MGVGNYEIIKRLKDENQDKVDSRYKFTDVLIDIDGRKFLESIKIKGIRESEDDRFHRVDSGEVNRMDLIAYNYYDNPRLWWVIAYANNIKNPLEIKSGDILRIPSINTLYGYGGILS